MLLAEQGFYIGRVYVANPPSTATATPTAPAEEAKSQYLQSPDHPIIIITTASMGFLISTTKWVIPQLKRVFSSPDKE